MNSPIWTDPSQRPITDQVWQLLNDIISHSTQLTAMATRAKLLIAAAHTADPAAAIRAINEEANKANPDPAGRIERQEAPAKLVEWDALREDCRKATAKYLDGDQFFIAWKSFVRAAKRAGHVSEAGYPAELVHGLLEVIENQQGYWANPNEEEVSGQKSEVSKQKEVPA